MFFIKTTSFLNKFQLKDIKDGSHSFVYADKPILFKPKEIKTVKTGILIDQKKMREYFLEKKENIQKISISVMPFSIVNGSLAPLSDEIVYSLSDTKIFSIPFINESKTDEVFLKRGTKIGVLTISNISIEGIRKYF